MCISIYNKERKTRTGYLFEPDRQNETGKTGCVECAQDIQNGTGKQGSQNWTGQAEWNRRNGTGRTRLPGQGCPGGSAVRSGLL